MPFLTKKPSPEVLALQSSLEWALEHPEIISREEQAAQKLYTLATYLFSEESPYEVKESTQYGSVIETSESARSAALSREGDAFTLFVNSHEYPYIQDEIWVIDIPKNEYRFHPHNCIGYRCYVQSRDVHHDYQKSSTSVEFMLAQVQELFTPPESE